MIETIVTDPGALRALARVALRDYSGERSERVPSWIGDLASLPAPNFHALDRLMHAGLVVWNDGWRLTEVGWKTLDAAASRIQDLR